MKVIIRDECGRITTFSGTVEDINKSINKNFNVTYTWNIDNKIVYFYAEDEKYTVEWFDTTEDGIKISKETISEYNRGFIDGAKFIIEKVLIMINQAIDDYNNNNQDDIL